MGGIYYEYLYDKRAIMDMLFLYDSVYDEVYQTSYGTAFVFEDEDEEDDEELNLFAQA